MIKWNVVIVIPTARKPPLRTLVEMDMKDYEVLLLADPRVIAEHSKWLDEWRHPNVTLIEGKEGLSPQNMLCYSEAARMGYDYYFRLDDDMYPHFFVHKDDYFPDMDDLIEECVLCAKKLNVSLVGFTNTSRRNWMGDGYKKTWGLINGAGHLAITTSDPSQFMDERLPFYGDVYRSAAHRVRDGAVGRVQFIGLDKREAMRDTITHKTQEGIELSKEIILGKFPDLVSCDGTRVLDGGNQEIPNWRMKRGKAWRS
jgi:hypothetical protein